MVFTENDNNYLNFQYVEKEVKVEDPELRQEVEKLSRENSELKSQVIFFVF